MISAHICVDTAEFDGTVVSRRSGLSLGALQPGEQVRRISKLLYTCNCLLLLVSHFVSIHNVFIASIEVVNVEYLGQ